MNKLCLVILMTCFPLFVSAGEVSIKWLDFNDYRDVRPANETKGAFHKRVQRQLDKHVNKLVTRLPQGYKLNMTFEDIDLAGDVRFNMHDIRVIKSIHFPRMKLTYKLTNKAGEVLTQAESKVIKDMGFMDRVRIGRDEVLYFDKRLITEWFKEDIESYIQQS
ncbi:MULTISPECIES: DUF3016 domain-containing protein [Pseudoalteromonas]|uniref:DUF3016 domain-containing protein n=1 Tax=Pseudoalteromonas aurantia 208 TaxID=1314867 RepID=A0ABR9E847_9GAMM|nr:MULTISPECIES: DUF3016 domain-containing protein [Pseudoalteromonas]MBE0366395.1 hypothetical protein [Pseudoalteromonas aurantia 208]MBQ4846539.1 DUF3016 domain-containing protein [Pseudoalteromonas sp. MMG005]MBQ4852024.1 DUF3016 domain-containing protein [Pseudoalteromonas sp. MMG012]